MNLSQAFNSFRQRMREALIHRFALTLMNATILILAYSGLKLTWVHLDPTDHFHEVVELWEGFGTIMVGFGVILEERKGLKQILKVELDYADEAISHDYGIFFVITGVIIEILAWLVKIPNSVLDTYQIEWIFVNLAALTAVYGVWLQFRFFWRLHFRKN
jgi:hypothetical protein